MDVSLDLKRLARVHKALGDRTRLQLVMLLSTESEPRQSAHVSSLANDLGIRQSLASVHLGTLRAAGLLARERRGRRVYYRLDLSALEAYRRQVVATLGEEFLACSAGVLPHSRHSLQSLPRRQRVSATGNGWRRRANGRRRPTPRRRHRNIDAAAAAGLAER